MTYDENLTETADVVRLAVSVLDCMVIPGRLVHPGDEAVYHRYLTTQTMKKMSEIMDEGYTPYVLVNYDMLVDRDAYMKMVYAGVGGHDLTPHELNMKREKALTEAASRILDVPVPGFQRYGVLKRSMKVGTDTVCLTEIRNSILNTKGMVFLWYDFGKRKETGLFPDLPVITW
jgi:hypothetical protein